MYQDVERIHEIYMSSLEAPEEQERSEYLIDGLPCSPMLANRAAFYYVIYCFMFGTFSFKAFGRGV